MLENCTDLLNCENRLSEEVESVRLLGEVPLSDQDIEILTGLVREAITPNISRGTRYLKTRAPACLACFLVGMGRFYDKETGYWPILEKKVGPVDTNWKVKWGKIFIQFLEQNGLPKFDEEEGLAYVTPILGHTCIPDCCLDEYFERVMVPLVDRELLNPLDQEEILHDLRVRRKINSNRLELAQKRNGQDDRLKAFQKESKDLKSRLEIFKEVASLLAEEEECQRRKIVLNGLEDVKSTRANLLDRIREVNENIQGLESEGKRLWGEITVFRQRYQPILECESQIDDVISKHLKLNQGLPEARDNEKRLFDFVIAQWTQLSTEPWDEKFGVEISGFPLEQLLSQIEAHQTLREQLKTVQVKIEILQASQKEQKKSPTFILALQSLISKTLIWFGRKKPVPQPTELQELQITYREIATEIHHQEGMMKELLAHLPVAYRLLEYSCADLKEEFNSLKIAYKHFSEADNKLSMLEEQQGQLNEQARELVSILGINTDGDINTWIDRLGEALKEAQRIKAIALKANQILENEIRPVLEANRKEYHCVQIDLVKLDNQLAQLGGSSVEKGVDFVEEFHRCQASVAQIRQNLSSRCPDLILLESELRGQGFETIRIHLEKTSAELENRIRFAKSESKRLEEGYDHYPAQYSGIDEPIRRFLLYGGITSELYLTNSVMLFAWAKSGEKAEDISDLKLPNRIIKSFQQWWEYYRTKVELRPTLEEETNPATGEIFRAPQIFFDTATDEVIAKLPSQRFLRPDRGTTVQLDIFSTDPTNPIYTAQLNLYNSSRGLVETHSFDDIVLTTPSEKYILRLKGKDNPIHEWEIPGPSDGAPFLAFSASSHKLIKGDHLPRSPLIIVVNKRLRIHPQECILTERNSLFGGWKEYVWYEVDLSPIEEFCLIGEPDQSFAIPLTSDLSSGIALLGGNQLTGIFSDERLVFNLSPESIRVPFIDRGDLHLLRISLLSGDENKTRKSKHYQVDELTNLISMRDEKWLDIPLKVEQLLGTDPIGCFTLRVYKPPYLDWQQSFCIIPQINASFGQEMYFPYWGKIPDITTTLTLPEKSIFKTDNPARLVSSYDRSWIIQTPVTEDEITGILSCSTTDGEKISIPLAVIVPKIRWRLQGIGDTQYDQWFDEVKEELWLGDWIESQELFLIVETPWFYVGKASLVLPSSSIVIEDLKSRDQKIRFDLKSLEDKLRAGPPLETITLSLKDTQTKIPDIPLFTARTCWQAEKIKCFHYPEGDKVRLDVSWKEKGKANQKAVRLWYLSGDQPNLIRELVVPQDVQEATFRSTATEVKSGKYLVHLEPYDQWSPRSVCPGLNDQNTAIIEIVTKAPEKAVSIFFVVVDAKHAYYLPPDSYRIHIIGKVISQKLPANLNIEDIDHVLITPLNENWFVGNLEVKGIPEVIAHLSDTNPVKFEYDTQKQIVTSIEDRHGDGAVYCYDCKMLFWYQETVMNEKKKKHRNYGPIEVFRVVWESG